MTEENNTQIESEQGMSSFKPSKEQLDKWTLDSMPQIEVVQDNEDESPVSLVIRYAPVDQYRYGHTCWMRFHSVERAEEIASLLRYVYAASDEKRAYVGARVAHERARMIEEQEKRKELMDLFCIATQRHLKRDPEPGDMFISGWRFQATLWVMNDDHYLVCHDTYSNMTEAIRNARVLEYGGAIVNSRDLIRKGKRRQSSSEKLAAVKDMLESGKIDEAKELLGS